MHLEAHNPNLDYAMTTNTQHTLDTGGARFTIYRNFNFSKHITKQINKPNQMLDVIKHTFATIGKENFLPR